MRNDVCARFGVEFPLFAFSHCRDVVAAVTNAGGFGVLGAMAYSPRQLDVELSRLDDQVGGRPYGVDVLVPGNLATPPASKPGTSPPLTSASPSASAVAATNALGIGDLAASPFDLVPRAHRDYVARLFAKYGLPAPPKPPARDSEGAARAGEVSHRITAEGATALIDIALKHPIALIANALGPPPPIMVERARAAGVPVAALVGTVEHARRQVAAGVDLIVAQGTEAGGHTGEISTMVLVPEVVDAVAPLPVLAAGGIATGRQMAAALALGASGVWCGSVWLTTEEAETSPVVKRKLLAATSGDTTRSRSRTGKPARQLTSAWTTEWDTAPESPGPLPMPLQMLLAEAAHAQIARAAEAGNPGAQSLTNYFVGQVVGQLNQIKPARQVVYEMIEEFAEAVERLERLTAPN